MVEVLHYFLFDTGVARKNCPFLHNEYSTQWSFPILSNAYSKQ
jgi:hypothetical protein